jgi:hypothetical protein
MTFLGDIPALFILAMMLGEVAAARMTAGGSAPRVASSTCHRLSADQAPP